MTPGDARRRFADARVAVLATINPDGTPNLVPVVFVVADQQIISAVDHKPKSTRTLQRLTNIERDQRVTLLTDGYADDWSELWWARAEGTASVSAEPPADLGLLLDRYPQYREHPPRGPFISVEVRRWSGWSAAP